MASGSYSGIEIVLNNYAKKTQASASKIPNDNLSNTEYSQTMMQTLNKYRKTKIFCDVCLIVEDVEVLAHRNVLAASSPFFESLLNTRMKEKDQYKISLAGMKSNVVKDVLDYIYVGDITMSIEKAYELIVAADYLMLGRLKNLTVDYLLTEHLNFVNCLSTWVFADRFQCVRLRNKARKLVLANFFEISRSEEFVGLDVSYLVELLGSEGLAASDREAFDAILGWVEHNVQERQRYFDQLIGSIDLVNLPKEYIGQVIATTHCAKHSEILKSYVKCRHECYSQMSDKEDNVQNEFSLGDPVVYYGNIAVLVVGGWEKGKGGVAKVNCYLPSVNKWFPLETMNIARYRHGITVHNGIVYALGGSLEADDSCVECLDINHPRTSWKRLLPMCSGHIGVAVTSLKGYLYVSGGFCGKTLNTVQCYNPRNNTWETVSPMMQAREGHCLISCLNYVYAIGGSCGRDNSEVLKGVERYDPHMDSWIPVSPMKTQRYGACGVELHHRIYIIGGQLNVYTNGPTIQTNFRSSEVYCPKVDQWDMIAELKIPRLRSCAAVVGHKIYVFGGYLHGGYLDTIECFDSRKGSWNIAGTLPTKLEGAACCAVQLDGKTISLLLQSESERKCPPVVSY